MGSTGELHPRNSQSLINSAYNATLTWAEPSLRSLEQQIMIPLFGESPVEQGITDANRGEILQRLRAEPRYDTLFAMPFPNEGDPITFENGHGLAAFVRGLVSFPLLLINLNRVI